MAVKAALAAALAWLAVLPLGGVANDYPYYAPFGALIAISGTVASSFRVSLQSIFAILLGAGVAFAAVRISMPTVALLALVIACGTLIAGWKALGSSGEWVPVSALFVLIIGNSDRMEYAIAYLGLTSFGAAIGIALNAAAPPLPLTDASVALAALRNTLADQLDALAEGLGGQRPPTPGEWEERQQDISPQTRKTQEKVTEASEAQRANWRATRWKDVADRQAEHARAIERLSLIVEDLTLLLIDKENSDREQVALGPRLRGPGSTALRSTAEVLRNVDEQNGDRKLLQEADEALEELVKSVLEDQRDHDGDFFAAGAFVTAIRQVLDSLRPEPARS